MALKKIVGNRYFELPIMSNTPETTIQSQVDQSQKEGFEVAWFILLD